jgi:hypothetical protein
MSNKAKYEVVFQFDFDEDNPKKFTNGRVNRIMKAHEGEFVSEYCDYGIKDISYDISSSAETLKTLMETVLKDAERSDVRMTCWAKRKMDLVIFNIADVEDKNVLFEKINEMRNSIGMRRINVSKYNEHEIAVELQNGSDKNFALESLKPVLEQFKAKDIAFDVESVEVMKFDNYKTRKNTFN